MIPWWSTDFGEPEIARVSAAIRDKKISQGSITREFEERLAATLGVPYVVCTTSGTTALTMALMAVGVKSIGAVIIPDRTWIATVHAAMMAGTRIKLADVDQRGLLPDVERKYGDLAIPVNLNGRMAICAPMDIEDSCQAFPQPPRGLTACYSLSTAKIIATGQGGFVATRDEALYRELRALRTHDVEDAMIPQVLTWRRFGYNFRFTDIQAAIGLAQLDRLPERLLRLQEIATLYRTNLPDYLEMVPRETFDGPELYIEVLYRESEDLRAYLLSHGIEARPFYPSLHTAPYLMPPHKTGYSDYEFPNSRRFEHGLTLPSGPAQRDADISRVLDLLHAYRP